MRCPVRRGAAPRLRAAAVLLGAALATSCDLGPGGPGSVSGTVTGSPTLGGAVLDVTWPGVVAFEGWGSTLVYWAPVSFDADRYRVVLVSPSGGDLPFTVSVDDAYLVSPSVTVVEATGTDNRALPLGSLRVVLER